MVDAEFETFVKWTALSDVLSIFYFCRSLVFVSFSDGVFFSGAR